MKQSSIEWFNQETWRLSIQLENKEVTLGEFANRHYDLFQQAKAMHKEEIDNALKEFLDCRLEVDSCEEYYRETFNTNEK